VLEAVAAATPSPGTETSARTNSVGPERAGTKSRGRKPLRDVGNRCAEPKRAQKRNAEAAEAAAPTAKKARAGASVGGPLAERHVDACAEGKADAGSVPGAGVPPEQSSASEGAPCLADDADAGNAGTGLAPVPEPCVRAAPSQPPVRGPSPGRSKTVGLQLLFLEDAARAPILVGQPRVCGDIAVEEFFSEALLGAMEELEVMWPGPEGLYVYRVDSNGGKRPITLNAAKVTALSSTLGFVFAIERFEGTLWAHVRQNGTLCEFAKLLL